MNTISMHEIEQLYQPGIGRHWFDADTMRFFRCRLASYGYQAADGKVYFVSSEKNHGMGGPYKRRYTVRVLVKLGTVDTVGEFQAYATRDTADRAARKAAEG